MSSKFGILEHFWCDFATLIIFFKNILKYKISQSLSEDLIRPPDKKNSGSRKNCCLKIKNKNKIQLNIKNEVQKLLIFILKFYLRGIVEEDIAKIVHDYSPHLLLKDEGGVKQTKANRWQRAISIKDKKHFNFTRKNVFKKAAKKTVILHEEDSKNANFANALRSFQK